MSIYYTNYLMQSLISLIKVKDYLMGHPSVNLNICTIATSSHVSFSDPTSLYY